MPERWPRLAPDAIAGLAGRPFHEVAVEVIHPFTGTRSQVRARALAEEAYARFDHAAVTPLVQVDRNRWILELFHGPTLAFKDVAMQLLARLMDHVLSARTERVTVIGATSGDTGGRRSKRSAGTPRRPLRPLFRWTASRTCSGA